MTQCGKSHHEQLSSFFPVAAYLNNSTIPAWTPVSSGGNKTPASPVLHAKVTSHVKWVFRICASKAP